MRSGYTAHTTRQMEAADRINADCWWRYIIMGETARAIAADYGVTHARIQQRIRTWGLANDAPITRVDARALEQVYQRKLALPI